MRYDQRVFARIAAMGFYVFPGNVGGPQALVETVTALRPETKD
jgi:hypothetical protein